MLDKNYQYSQRVAELEKEWNEREERLGKTKRAVLFKRFPNFLNNHIHKQHVKFILENIPSHTQSVLDLGAGYGRISGAIRDQHPVLKFTGVDLCREFALTYEKEFGNSFHGSIQAFIESEQSSEETYDLIIMVTIIMYLSPTEYKALLFKLWQKIDSGTVLICIEPAIEFMQLWQKLTGTKSASPTGGDVNYFSKNNLINIFADLPNHEIVLKRKIYPFPLLPMFPIHHGIAIRKV